MYCENQMFYIIAKGDTLYKIAQKYQTSVEQILKLNPGIGPYTLPVGAQIVICPSIKNISDTTLNKNMRKFYTEEAWWLRMLIIAIIDSTGGQKEIKDRLDVNSHNIASLYALYYNSATTEVIRNLLDNHIMIAESYFYAVKNADLELINELEKKWHSVAINLAAEAASINSYYDQEVLKSHLLKYIELIKTECFYHLHKLYKEDINSHDKLLEEALFLADYLSKGLFNQFNIKRWY